MNVEIIEIAFNSIRLKNVRFKNGASKKLQTNVRTLALAAGKQ